MEGDRLATSFKVQENFDTKDIFWSIIFMMRKRSLFHSSRFFPMLKTSGILTLSKGSCRNMQFLWWPLHGIPFGTPLKNITTLLEATRTSTPDGLAYIKKGTRQYQTSPIFSIPYAPNWLSNILSLIWFSNNMVVFIDTFKQKCSSWTYPH